VRMRRNGVSSAFDLKTAVTSPATMISYEGDKIVAIWQQHKRGYGIFSLRMHINGYLGTFGQKSDLAIR